MDRVWTWTGRREEAARLVAQDDLNDEQIAAAIGVRRATLATWKNQPEFRARVQEIVDGAAEAAKTTGIADKVRRLREYDERWRLLRQIRQERATNAMYSGVPGGSTGLLVRTVKRIGVGRDSETVEEFSVDTGLLAEMRQLEQQAAKELGQWVEKKEHSGKIETPLRIVEMVAIHPDA